MGAGNSVSENGDDQLQPLVGDGPEYGTTSPDQRHPSGVDGLASTSDKIPTGRWKGYILLRTANMEERILPSPNRWHFDVILEVESAAGDFSGKGKDQKGTPVLLNDGRYEDGTVTFTKEYMTHDVCYKGELRGTQLEGEWWLPSQPEHSGVFSMWLDTDFLPTVIMHQGTDAAAGFCRRLCCCC